MNDKDILDQIEDLLVNNFGEDDRLTRDEAIAMLDHITELVNQRGKQA